MVELVNAYWKHAQACYQPRPGCSDGELDGIRLALRVVKWLYADTTVGRFGPRSLRAVRDAMVAQHWSRSYAPAASALQGAGKG